MKFDNDALSTIETTLSLIEENLTQPLKSDDIFRWLGVSKSSFTPLFKAITGYPLNQYIRYRRLSEVAFQYQQNRQSAYQLALNYQYQSHEAFYRAFKQYFGIPISKYRTTNITSQIFPPISYTIIRQGGKVMINKEMNQPIIQETLQNHPGSCLVDVDIDHFMTINEKYGYSVGDAVLAQTLLRIKQVCDEYQNIQGPWRYGNDEFLFVTRNHPKEIIEKILRAFESPMHFQQHEVDVSISIGTALIAEDSIPRAQNSMLLAKKQGRKRADVSQI
jgi:diguanylate cyclase (GGDEF)-like protein